MPRDLALWNTLSGENSLTTPGDRNRFASPWADVASQYAPRTFRDALVLCEHLYCNNALYRAASERVVNYFVTKPKLTGPSDSEIEKFAHVFEGDFGALERLTEIGYDFMAYGNAFASVIAPFTRVLACIKCQNGHGRSEITDRSSDEHSPYESVIVDSTGRPTQSSSKRAALGSGSVLHIDEVDFEFQPETGNFLARCPYCRTITPHRRRDYPRANPRRIRLQRWDPKRITIDFDPITGSSEYYLDIDAQVQARVRRGDPFLLRTLPWAFVEAVCQGKKFKFNDDAIFHLRQPTLAGLQLYGWGLPSILSSFRNFFRLQVLRRHDEVLAMDYIVPMRIVSPAGSVGGGNSILEGASMQSFRQNFESSFLRHRQDGADLSFFPFPVNFQNISGDGRQFSPKDLIEAEQNDLLNARGIPAELYRGTLTVQVAPVGLRLFERGQVPFVAGLNRCVQWMATAVARILRVGDVEAGMESVTVVDDIQNQQARAQLMQAQILSRETGLSTLGLDAKAEKKKLLEEQKQDQRDERLAQSELEMEQMNLDTPEGDAQGSGTQGGGGGGQGGATPMDVQGQGKQLAQQLVRADEGSRRQQLATLRQQNPTLHAVVVTEMEKARGQADLLGRGAGFQAMDQQAQGAPPS